MKSNYIIAALLIAAAATAQAQGRPDSPGNSGGNNATNPGGQDQGFISRDFTYVETETNIFMGMSDRLAPNDRAAASQGTRTEETVIEYTVTVEGPKGQVDKVESLEDAAGCNNCTVSEPRVTDERSEVTDLPGASR
jgi:hypothetical protein